MTCKEKLKELHPDWSEDVIDHFIYEDCPFDHAIAMFDPYYCDPYTEACTKCWDRVISEEDLTIDKVNEDLTELKDSLEDTPPGEMKPHILDSGDRTQFESGAVRDMREGKGRCDLMPLEVVAKWLKTKVLDCIAQFKIHGDTIYLYGAMNYFLDDAGWSYWEACLEVAKHFEEGAKKYGESNWQKGIPVHCYIDSALRHYFKFMCGMKDEPHDRAFVWNLMCCIWEVDYGEECRKSKEETQS